MEGMCQTVQYCCGDPVVVRQRARVLGRRVAG